MNYIGKDGSQTKSSKDVERVREKDLPPWQLDWPLGFIGSVLEEAAEQREEAGMEKSETISETSLGRKRVQLQELVDRLGIQDLVIVKELPMEVACPRCGDANVFVKESGSTMIPSHRFVEHGQYHYHDPNWHNQKFECKRCAKIWHLRYAPRCPNMACEWGGEWEIVESD